MVCSVESGRMAVMARILDAGSFSQSVPAAEAGHQKLVSQYVRRGLCAADEANLLDEEDMHVYDLMPMEDPLHLVCCNACKKPVKASQFATHAEFCRFLNSGETILEVDGAAENRKPPRKERKNLLKSNSSCVDVAPEMDHSGGSLGYTDQSGSAVPQRKRSKWILNDRLTLSDDPEVVCGVTEFSQEANACREFPNGSIARIGKCGELCVGHHKPKHISQSSLPIQDVPVPLATKVFYPQKTHRLRSAIGLMYHGESTMVYSNECSIQGPLPGTSVE